MSRGAQYRLGGAVPSPAAAFLVALILLPVPVLAGGPEADDDLPPARGVADAERRHPVPGLDGGQPAMVDAAITAISALGSAGSSVSASRLWAVRPGQGPPGSRAAARPRHAGLPDGMGAEVLRRHPPITFDELVAAMFNVGGFGLDDIAVFPAGHALRAMAFYGLVAFCIARACRRPAAGDDRLRGGRGPDLRHRPGPDLPQPPLPAGRGRGLDGRGRPGLGPGRDPCPQRGRAGAGRRACSALRREPVAAAR